MAISSVKVPLLYDPPEPAEIAAVLVSVQDWYTVGMRLDMDIADLDIIKHNGKTSEDKKRAMGRLWLDLMEASGGQPSWRTLLRIVSNMGATKSAELISRNYRPGVPRPDPVEEFPTISIGSKPKMKHLQYIPDLSGSIRVVQEIASEWEVVARQLDVSEAVIRQFKRAKSGRLEEQCIDSLVLWLDGACKKPVTWETLVAVLFNAQYSTLARKLLRRLE